MTFVLDNYDSFVTPSGMRPYIASSAEPTPTARSTYGAHPTRGDGAHRSALGAIVSCGEGTPLPAPLPRGAVRRERAQGDPS